MSEIRQINSAISLLYFKGVHDKRLLKILEHLFSDWDALRVCCDPSVPLAYCNFDQFYTLDTAGNAWPKSYTNATLQACANRIVQMGFYSVWETLNDVYNTYQVFLRNIKEKKTIRIATLEQQSLATFDGEDGT